MGIRAWRFIEVVSGTDRYEGALGGSLRRFEADSAVVTQLISPARPRESARPAFKLLRPSLHLS